MSIGERKIGIDHLVKQAEKFSNMSAQDPTTDAIDRVQIAIYLVGAVGEGRFGCLLTCTG